MTIELRNVTKKVRLGAVRVTYEGLDIRVEKNSRVAFLGRKDAGLEAIVKLICAADAPDKGVVSRTHSISWPIPDGKFLQRHLSLAANARFIARLYEQDETAFLQKVTEMAEPGDFLNERGEICPKDVISRFCFSVGICLPFDHYILTGMNVGSKEDRPRFGAIVEDLAQRAGILLVCSEIKAAKQICDQAYVFDDGRATFFDDMEAAAEFFGGIASKGGDEEDFFDADPELENLVTMDL
jgi:capsular polysaccharide transport system ATP-binding protein